MAIERTFSMIKPDATKRNLTGAITKMLEDAGLRVVASKRVWMSKRQAEGFYAVHKDRPFFGELVEGMTSGPTVVQVLEGENAILKNREIMGATNRPTPPKAPSARRMPSRSAKTRFTAPTPRKPLPKKSPTGSPAPKSSADFQRTDISKGPGAVWRPGLFCFLRGIRASLPGSASWRNARAPCRLQTCPGSSRRRGRSPAPWPAARPGRASRQASFPAAAARCHRGRGR